MLFLGHCDVSRLAKLVHSVRADILFEFHPILRMDFAKSPSFNAEEIIAKSPKVSQ
jgi:hypothetical protein